VGVTVFEVDATLVSVLETAVVVAEVAVSEGLDDDVSVFGREVGVTDVIDVSEVGSDDADDESEVVAVVAVAVRVGEVVFDVSSTEPVGVEEVDTGGGDVDEGREVSGVVPPAP
jgi:hypothetical protein